MASHFGRYYQEFSKPPKTAFIQYIGGRQLYFCFGLEAKMCEENKTTRSHEIAVIAASYSTFSSALKQMKEVKDQWGAFYQVLLSM